MVYSTQVLMFSALSMYYHKYKYLMWNIVLLTDGEADSDAESDERKTNGHDGS